MITQIEPWIDHEELIQLQRVIDSTYVVEHNLTKEFELKTKELTQSPFVVSATNGTMALYMCLKACDIGPGDEVIVPNITFVATANAVIMAGAKPVLCEIDERSLCIDPNKIIPLINKNTKAIIPVHLYGNAAEVDLIQKIAEDNNLFMIEDAAQGVGVFYKKKHTGTYGKMGILSYYGNKTITCGEGGIVLTSSEQLAQKAYRLKNHGRDKKGTFIHQEIGFNFSFTEMQAAIGIAQMNKLDRIIKKKKEIYELYLNELSSIGDLKPQWFHPECNPVHWFTSFFTEHVNDLAAFLLDKKVITRRFFYPLHLQPCYQGILNTKANFSISEKVYNRGISLPSSYGLDKETQLLVCSLIKEFYANRNFMP